MAPFRLNWLSNSLIAAAAIVPLGFVAPASAAVIGIFDPAFGGQNPALYNLGFRGTFQLEVSAGCYGQANPYVFTGNGCSITVDTVTVNFYNVADDPTGTQEPFIQSYTLGGAGDSTFATTPDYITGGYFDPTNDQLVGIDTVDSNPFSVYINQGSGNSNAPIYYNSTMLLYFKSGYEPAGVGVDPAFLVDCSTAITENAGTCNRNTYNTSTGATVVITTSFDTVPEPDTIPLALIGVGALAALGTRKRSTSERKRLIVD